MSFNFGPTLHRWIEKEDPALDQTIRESGTKAVAQCYSHMIMPLASAEDKKTQTIWGIRDFEYRFKRSPKGMWLPETAVNTRTLEVLNENGITFTILAPSQCEAVIVGGTRMETHRRQRARCHHAVLCRLPPEGTITIVFYHEGLTHDIAFGKLLEKRRQVQGRTGRSSKDPLGRQALVVATDGETYGHHHKFGEMACPSLEARCGS